MSETYNFQEMIQALHKFWGEQGALIWHPYYSQVGAGTMNPSTFLRVLGPEPFNVGYVEPSVRPDDGRYGENPNRLQTFYQYQVILKPDPGNAQEVYLDSLRAIGIDPHQHDIRFVEDNWESPALGAWGLGWEVWLDGLEITQFTYFQQTGQIDLNPVSVEITYGLDRIAAPLQGVRNFKDIQWSEKRTFGDMNMQAEKEQSQYYFEVADVERNHQMYNLHAEEVRSALDAGLVLPAYDNLLRLSHIFNILDTRGAIGVTERADYFRRMRGLAKDVAKLYVEGREQGEYPWLEEDDVTGGAISGHDLPDTAAAIEIATPSKAADVLLEIGTEELPPADLDNYLAQLESAVPTLLSKLRLEHGAIKIVGTPRRLVMYVENVAASQPDKEDIAKGPPADRAFAADGEPTKAAEGFARGKGVDVKDLTIEEIDGGRYVVAKVFEKGRGAIEVLVEALPGLIASLKVDRTMRWNSSNVTFSRPIRWLAGVFGEDVIPYQYANLTAGKHSRGLRFGAQERFEVKDAADYFKKIEAEGIILDVETRRAEIWQQVQELAKSAGGEVTENPDLLAEVTHLVEAPTALTGEFEEKYLDLPREVLISVMRKHQRYFPVEKGGELLPYFITVSNGPTEEREIVSAGNAAVVRARFADAAFFVSNDRKLKLDDYVSQLDTLTFQKKLGSMKDKTDRIVPLTEELASTLGLGAEETKTAKRAAELAKADLMTSMVVEMTSLQGIMGQKYAIESGESAEVGLAIHEHYLPAGAGGAAPSSKAGLVVGIADRLDSLAGLFAAGLAPTGSKDPFALRRAALGIIQNLIAWEKDFDLKAGLKAAAGRLPIETTEEQLAEAFEFIKGRMRVLLLDEGYKYDVVDAVLSAQANNPASAARAIKALSEFVGRDDWTSILDSYSRCVRITRDKKETFNVKPEAFSEAVEKALFTALETAEGTTRAPGSAEDFFNAFLPMMPAITQFFDDVLVMSEDEQEKANRLGMLQRIAALTEGIADLSHLEGF